MKADANECGEPQRDKLVIDEKKKKRMGKNPHPHKPSPILF